MRPKEYRLTSAQGAPPMRYDYAYFGDGRLRRLTDLDDRTGDPHTVQFHYMSRAYQYDLAGRVSGVGAAGINNVPAPFTGSYQYDEFGNLTSRAGHYALNPDQTDTTHYTNNRRDGWTYDADGRVTGSADSSDSGGASARTWAYDAAGREVSVTETRNGTTTVNALAYDGDGQLVYESVTAGGATTADYLVRSSVLGAVVTKLDAAGGKQTTYVPAGGLAAPMQVKDWQGNPSVGWVHRDVTGLQEDGRAYDPFGNLVSNAQPPLVGPPPYTPFYGPGYAGATSSSFNNANNFSVGCTLDGVSAPCASVMRALSATAKIDSISSTGLVDLAGLGLVPTVTKQPPPRPGAPPHLKPPTGPGNPRPGNPNPYGIQGEDIWGLSWTPIGEVASIGPLFIAPQVLSLSPTPQCDPGFFDANDDAHYRGFSGNDLNTVARLVYAEAAGTDRGGTDEEMDAIVSVVYNRLHQPGYFNRPPNETLSDVVFGAARNRRGEIIGAPQFEAATGFGGNGSNKWRNTVGDNYQSLGEAECNDLRRGVNAVKRLLERGKASHAFTRFLAASGRTPKGWTVIGGTRF